MNSNVNSAATAPDEDTEFIRLVAIAKEAFSRYYPDEPPANYERPARKIAWFIHTRDALGAHLLLGAPGRNKVPERAFQQVTGIVLYKRRSDRRRQLDEWASLRPIEH